MNLGNFIDLLGREPFFDLATAVQLTGEGRATLRIQLHRWMQSGKLIPLRRGMYSLAQRYRRGAVNPTVLANGLYTPSYLSGLWAMGFYGLIPEKVVTYTSVTPRVPRRFKNAFGQFEYRHVKQELFFGYRMINVQGDVVRMAEPEKALLDYWHLHDGSWTSERMAEMRFQNHDLVDVKRLRQFAQKCRSPRLLKAADVWREEATVEQEGTVDV